MTPSSAGAPAAPVHRPRGTPAAAPAALLGGRSVPEFLRGFWHKDALLVRAALPGFAGLFTAAELQALAMRDDVESRLVVRDGSRWSFAEGPFRRADFRSLPARQWTLLVQGVNLHSAPADALLRRFSFLPYARLDDLMVSYAVPGGGVGPHFDSYDVFLLQGFGRRRWRYGPQDDLELKPGLPVKILRRFAPAHDDVLGPGDLLYLPPQFAHDGIAVDACTTYSIGFRAASANELAAAFLDFLRDEVDLDGRYADPDLAATRTPARIGAAMRRQCARQLARLRWDGATVARFLGSWLSEPKPTVFFAPPPRPLARAAFARRLARHGVRLDRKTQLLYDDRHLFVNGTAVAWEPLGDGAPALRRLADDRRLAADAAGALPAACVSLLHRWHCDGYLDPTTT
ncbi:MAG: cupin domain-containing protein [Betaproteobacteria bacterium]|nr:cupin domain-containing protein [Betaproteobacteria bacterium]